MTTAHYTSERERREELIKKIGEGTSYAKFNVDRGHKDGPEIHVLTTTGIIIIYNAITKRLVTKLIARPGQIYRYYQDGNAPQNIVNIARQHTALGYNHY